MGSVNSEVEAAFDRLLATVPAETHAVLRSAKYMLGKSKLIAENAERHGVDVTLPEWEGLYDCDYFELQFTVLGHTFTINESSYSEWEVTNKCCHNRTMRLKGPTFAAVFDLVLKVIRGEYVFGSDGDDRVTVVGPYLWGSLMGAMPDDGAEGSGEQ